jgi:hypothetical protein
MAALVAAENVLKSSIRLMATIKAPRRWAEQLAPDIRL